MEVGIGAGNQKKEKLSGLATEMETPIAFSQPPRDADKTEPGESALCQSAVLCRAGQPASRPMPCHAMPKQPCQSAVCIAWCLLAFTTPFLYHTIHLSISLPLSTAFFIFG